MAQRKPPLPVLGTAVKRSGSVHELAGAKVAAKPAIPTAGRAVAPSPTSSRPSSAVSTTRKSVSGASPILTSSSSSSSIGSATPPRNGTASGATVSLAANGVTRPTAVRTSAIASMEALIAAELDEPLSPSNNGNNGHSGGHGSGHDDDLFMDGNVPSSPLPSPSLSLQTVSPPPPSPASLARPLSSSSVTSPTVAASNRRMSSITGGATPVTPLMMNNNTSTSLVNNNINGNGSSSARGGGSVRRQPDTPTKSLTVTAERKIGRKDSVPSPSPQSMSAWPKSDDSLSSGVMSPSSSSSSISGGSSSSGSGASASISSWGPSGGVAGTGGSRDNFLVVIRARKIPADVPSALTIAGNMITINREGKQHQFSYDTVYGPETKQKDVYHEKARIIVGQALEGFNGTIFAYGQTGSGKTHTMMGDINDVDMRGITPSMVDHIFTHIGESNAANVPVEYIISASFLEIYNEQVRDLFGSDTRANLDVRESPQGFVVPDLTKREVKSRDALMRLIHNGFALRATSATSQNVVSSRSHSLITIYIDKKFKSVAKQDDPNAAAAELLRPMVSAKLNFVDLAGSERMQDASAVNKETQNINKSLSCLANVISALTTPPKDPSKPPHIPYRDSKLTRLLKDSLGGNAKTLMIACLHPAASNARESLSTLRYASRAKSIKNTPKVNMGALDSALADMQTEIDHLNKLLQRKTELTVACCQLVHDLQRLFKLSGANEEKDDTLVTSDGVPLSVTAAVTSSSSSDDSKGIVQSDDMMWQWLDRLVPPSRPSSSIPIDNDDDEEDVAPSPEVPWLEPEVVERVTRLRSDVRLVMKAMNKAQRAARRAAMGGLDSMSMMTLSMSPLPSSSSSTSGSGGIAASSSSNDMYGGDDADDVAFAVQMRSRAEIAQLLNHMTMKIHDDTHEQQHAALQTQLENVRRELATKREEWRRTAKETAREMNELNTLSETRGASLTAMTLDRDNARMEASSLTTQLERTRLRISSMGDDITTTRDELTKTTEYLTSAKDQLSKMTAEMTIIRGQLTRSNDEVNQTRAQLTKVNEDLAYTRERLSHTADDLTNQLKQLATEVSKHTITRSELQQVNERAENDKLEYGRTRDDLHRTHSELTKIKEQLASTIGELSLSRINVASEQVLVAKTREELQHVQEMLSMERTSHSRTRDESENTADELAKKREQLTTTINDLADVRHHLATEKSDHTKTRTTLASVEERCEELVISLKASTSNNADAESILAKTRSELESTQSELDDVKQQLHRWRTDHAAANTKYATEMDRLVGSHRDRMDAQDSELTRLREDMARARQQIMDATNGARAMEASYMKQIADIEEASSAAVAAAIASAAKTATTPTPASSSSAIPRFQIHAATAATAAATVGNKTTIGKDGSPSRVDTINGKTAIVSSEMGPPAPAPVVAVAPLVIDRTLGSELRILREALADVQEDVKAAQQENARLNAERERLATIIDDMERSGSSSSSDGSVSADTKEMADRLSVVLQQLEDREVELAITRGDADTRIASLRAEFAARRDALTAELISKRKIASKLARDKADLTKEKKSLTASSDQLKMVVASKRAAGDALQEKKIKRLEHSMQVERNRKELERNELYGRIEVYRRKEFEWEKMNNERDIEIRQLTRRNVRQTNELQRVEKQVDDMQSRLTSTMDAAQKREDDWNAAWTEKEQAMAALQARIQIANMERDKATSYMARYGPGRLPSTTTSSSYDNSSNNSSGVIGGGGMPSSLSGGSGAAAAAAAAGVRSPLSSFGSMPLSSNINGTPTTSSNDNGSLPVSMIRPPRIFSSPPSSTTILSPSSTNGASAAAAGASPRIGSK